MCASQRNGDYDKWKWFDCWLYEAIIRLNEREYGSFPVYSGLKNVKLDQKVVRLGYFVTYVSTSWKRKVAENFMGRDKGMIIQFDQKYKSHLCVKCCDVSWISKFPDECEVLFARSIGPNIGSDMGTNFKCFVLNESNGVQV